MKNFYKIFLLSLLPLTLLSQQYIYEMPFTTENNVVKSRRVNIAFNSPVIITPVGIDTVNTTEFKIKSSSFDNLLNQLSVKYGKPQIIKRHPNAVWGDTLIVNKRTGKVNSIIDVSQSFSIDFQNMIPLDSVISLFERLPNIRYAEPPLIIAPLTTPNDTYFNSQWYLTKINASKAWDITRGSSSIKAAVIDGGYATVPFNISNHEDFQLPGGGNKFVGGSLNNSSDHSRAVAGIIGAVTNNNIGIASLGWNTSLMAWHFVQGTAETNLPGLINLARIYNADVINFSFTVLNDNGCPTTPQSVLYAIYNAYQAGVIMVAAAGNTQYSGCTFPFESYPAASEYVIAVSATNQYDNFPTDWNYGDYIDVAAPGSGEILSTYNSYSSYNGFDGTSFATPQVSALVSLILSIKSDLTLAQIKSILHESADKVGQYDYVNGKNDYLGYGRINAYNALKYTLENYGGTLTQSFTIPSGETWTFQDGVTLNFASGISLTVNGTLIADGVTFTRSGASGTWGGIIFDGASASNSILNNVDIRYAAQVECKNSADVTIQNSSIENGTHGIYIYNAAPIIVNNRILNNSGNGIYGEANGKSPLIKNNEIKKTPYSSYQGIFLNNNSNPYITGNDIKGYLHGIYFGGGGSGYLTDEYYYTPAQNNRITYNSNGITVAWGSYLTAGIPTYPYAGGKNSIWANTTDAYAYEQGSIIGTRNWWGSDGAQTSTASGGYIDSSVPLGSDPWPASPPPKINPLVNQPVIKNNAAASAVSDAVSFSDIYKGIELETEGKIDEAVIHYKKMINNDVHAGFALSSLAKIKNKFSKGGVENYFNDLSVKNNLRKELNFIASNLYAGMLLDKGSYNEAINIFDNIIAQSQDSYFGVNAMFEKFFAALHYKKDRNKAGKLLSEIQSLPYDYEDFLIRKEMAEYLFNGEFTDGSKENGLKNSGQTVEETAIPEEYALLNNYPNPFNPVTNISYHLPDAGFVTLKIFDVLGNEIATLVNGVKEKGVHSVQFNASNLPSGVYIYTIRANNLVNGSSFTASKKMILAK